MYEGFGCLVLQILDISLKYYFSKKKKVNIIEFLHLSENQGCFNFSFQYHLNFVRYNVHDYFFTSI